MIGLGDDGLGGTGLLGEVGLEAVIFVLQIKVPS